MTVISNISKPGTNPSSVLILLSFLACLPAAAAAGDTSAAAQDLINQMSRAARVLNYDGIFIYRSGSQMDTMRLVHKASDEGEFEHLVSLTGHAREVIRNNQSVTCIFPDNKEVMVEQSRSSKLISQLPEPVEKIADYYRFAITGEDRVAGRNCSVVTIEPLDKFRYGYKLWIDKDQKLLLKSELRDAAGQPIEQVLFTQLQVLDKVPDELLRPSVSATGFTWHDNTGVPGAQADGRSPWQAGWMPGGFSMRSYEKKILTQDEGAVDHLVYTDGLAMVSIFIEKLKPARMSAGSSRKGAVNAFVRIADDYQITAVGEVPGATVQRMAISVVTNR